MPDSMSNRMSEYMPDSMSDRMSEYMSDRIPDRIRQNVRTYVRQNARYCQIEWQNICQNIYVRLAGWFLKGLDHISYQVVESQ